MFYSNEPHPSSLAAVHDPLFLLYYCDYQPEFSSAIDLLSATDAHCLSETGRRMRRGGGERVFKVAVLGARPLRL